MEPSEPLRNLLSNLAKGYAGRDIEVEFDEQPRITEDGERIYVWNNPAEVLGLDVDGANEFRIIRDSLNHECAHDNYSELAGKAAFSARYPPHSKLAGTVLNIFEDAYIDSRRLAEYPGLRGAHAFFTESQVADADVSEQSIEQALVSCVHLFAQSGRVPGIRDADDEVREFAAFVKPHVEAVRRHDDALEREHIAARVTEELIERLPKRPDLDDLLDDLADAVSGEVPDEAEVEAADPSELDPEDVADALPDEPDKWADEDEQERPDPKDMDAAEFGESDVPDDLDDLPEADDAGESGAGDETAEDDPEDTEGGSGVGDDEAEGEDDESGAESGEDGGESDASEDEGDGTDDDTDADESGESDDAQGEGSKDATQGTDEAEQGDDPDASDMDDLADHLDELDDRDERGEAPEYHGLDDDTDYESASESDERRYERVEDEAVRRNETDMGRRKARRDDRAEQASLGPRDADSDEVRQVLRESGLAEDIRQAFETFATLDVTERGEDGDRLNTEAAVRHMAGDYSETQVYETDYTSATGGRAIGVALDVSNSMNSGGSALVNDHLDNHRGAVVDAKVALGAIHLATHELGDEFVSSAFHAPGSPSTPLITGPGESFDWSHLDSVTYGGTTPTAHAVLDTLELVEREGGKDEVVLVVTDGLPKDGHPDLPGSTYAVDAAIAVRMAREQGVGVIGIGVGDDVREGLMGEMFGEDGYVMTDSDDLVSELVNIYADQLDYERPPGY